MEKTKTFLKIFGLILIGLLCYYAVFIFGFFYIVAGNWFGDSVSNESSYRLAIFIFGFVLAIIDIYLVVFSSRKILVNKKTTFTFFITFLMLLMICPAIFISTLSTSESNKLFYKQYSVNEQTASSTLGLSIGGPTNLSVGQSGNWSAGSPGYDSYAVIWADGTPVSVAEGSGIPNESGFGSSYFFTHSFSKIGTYYPQFFAKDSKGNVKSGILIVTVTK